MLHRYPKVALLPFYLSLFNPRYYHTRVADFHSFRQSAMKLQIASDLHLEYYGDNGDFPSDIIERGDGVTVLALLGDIGYPCTAIYSRFLAYCADLFPVVLVLPGNHELYNRINRTRKYTVDECMQCMRNACAQRQNLKFMHNESITIDKVRFVCSTLWSHVSPEHEPYVSASLGDYNVVFVPDDNINGSNGLRKLSVKDTNLWHRDAVAFIAAEITDAEAKNEQVVVLTHHTPTFQGSSHPRFGDGASPLSSAFSTDLHDLLMQPPVKVWAHGHTHYNNDRMIGSARVVSNQRGYPKPFVEETSYNPEKVIEIT